MSKILGDLFFRHCFLIKIHLSHQTKSLFSCLYVNQLSASFFRLCRICMLFPMHHMDQDLDGVAKVSYVIQRSILAITSWTHRTRYPKKGGLSYTIMAYKKIIFEAMTTTMTAFVRTTFCSLSTPYHDVHIFAVALRVCIMLE